MEEEGGGEDKQYWRDGHTYSTRGSKRPLIIKLYIHILERESSAYGRTEAEQAEY